MNDINNVFHRDSVWGLSEQSRMRGHSQALQVNLVVKNLPANAGDIRDSSSIPWSGRLPGGGHSNPLRYSCLEDPMDRRGWRDSVHRVTKNPTRLK